MDWTHVQVLSWIGMIAETGVLKDNMVVSFFSLHYNTNFILSGSALHNIILTFPNKKKTGIK